MKVNISETAEIRIRELALKRGEDVAEFAGQLLEEKVNELPSARSKPKKLSDLAGMFFGGPGDTAERHSEILRSEMGISSLGRD